MNYLPFSISYYSSTVHTVQNTRRNNTFKVLFICSFIFCWIRIYANVPDPCGSGSTTLDSLEIYGHVVRNCVLLNLMILFPVIY